MKVAALSLVLVAGAAGDSSTTKQLVVSKENGLHEQLEERRINELRQERTDEQKNERLTKCKYSFSQTNDAFSGFR